MPENLPCDARSGVLCNSEKWWDPLRVSIVVLAMPVEPGENAMKFQPAIRFMQPPRDRWRHAASLALSCGLAATGLLTGCAPDGSLERQPRDRGALTSEARTAANITFTSHVHAMPVRPAAAPTPALAPPLAYLQRNGGKIIEAPKVVQVLYGRGTYIPQLTSTPPPNMASAYREMVSSSVFGWLAQYNTGSPLQRTGRGRFVQSNQIEPAASRNGPLITDADVQSELAAQIQSGALPAPDDNTLYMVHFPEGKTNVAPDGALSCSAFCAYHGTFQIGGQDVYYSVLPDLGGHLGGIGCVTGCGTSSTFDNQTEVA
ncbi:MAG TPA: hypothetical protein VF469_36315, partial [Kofleriaceae bacterium]